MISYITSMKYYIQQWSENKWAIAISNNVDEFYKGNDRLKNQSQGLRWQSSGWDSTLPTQGTWVRSLVGEVRFPHATRYGKNNNNNKTSPRFTGAYIILYNLHFSYFLIFFVYQIIKKSEKHFGQEQNHLNVTW